jgi:hypothetical protein
MRLKTATARFEGDSVAVDTSERRCVYMASPLAGMRSPVERANMYLRSLRPLGYDVTLLDEV